MNGILLDNWTIERIVQSMNDLEQPFSVEAKTLIELLVLWDDFYYCDNGYTTFWREHSMVDGVDLKKLFKPIVLKSDSESKINAVSEYYTRFYTKSTPVVAQGALEYMNISNELKLSYMPFGNRAEFIRENNLYLAFKQYYDRYDAIHSIDKDIFAYYEDLNENLRKVDIKINPNIIFASINRESNSFSDMVKIAREWSQRPIVTTFKEWVTKLEDDVTNFKSIEIARFENELRDIEQSFVEKQNFADFSVSLGIPCSIGLSLNLPFNKRNQAHLLFPTTLYLKAVTSDIVLQDF